MIGLAMILLGGNWILRGCNIAFPGSFMANDKPWAQLGAILALVGAGRIYRSNNRAR